MKILNIDCLKYMKELKDNSVDFTLTDIPYDEVQRKTNGLSQMKSLDTLNNADKLEFDLDTFLKEVYRVTKNSICIFCGQAQFSEIIKYFKSKPGTVRPIIYEKTNPVPSNGKYIYLSGVEFAVWFKKRGAKVFNAYCKNTVFRYPIYGGKKRIHPTQKHPELFKELIEDNTDEGQIVFDPCAGGMTTALAAHKSNRECICCELSTEFYEKGIEMLKSEGVNIDAANKGYLTARTDKASDEVFTPAYAVRPLLKYLKLLDTHRIITEPPITIWCPFDEEWSQYVQILRNAGYKVIATHINNGQNFFYYEPEEDYDIIISNPPFSVKDDVLRRLDELGKPYAMLLPVPTLQGQSRFPYMKDIQYLGFDKRINYYKDTSMTKTQDGVSFGSCYLCKKFLPRDLIIEELVRE